MSVERYVRIIAGTLVLASALLGYCVHHYWLFLTMFVGANLLQSGFTRWCLMENILEKSGVGQISYRDKQ